MTNATITLELTTKRNYPDTYTSSEVFYLDGVTSAFIYRDSTHGDFTPGVSLIGTMLSAHARTPRPIINVGDSIRIGGDYYTLTVAKVAYPGNGDYTLTPAPFF